MNYHLLKAGGEWRLREQGSDEDLFSTATKSEALEKLGDYMDSREGNVLVHKADGEIQEHRSYGREQDAAKNGGLNGQAWGIIGVVAVAAVTAATVAWYFRDSLPTDRLRIR